LQVIVHDESPEWLPLVVTYSTLFLGLIDHSVHFLLTHEWSEAKLEDSFNASLSAAMLIWRAIDDDVRMTEKLVELGSEVCKDFIFQ
jgi:mannose/cellobiose epimerase-like protein (N-acyl-D-glucosamine 2-epimerase family)